MFDYETGVVLAFLLWLYQSILLFVTINSTLERNLNRIGQRVSWLSLTPKPMNADDQSKSLSSKVLKYLLIVGIALPFVLLSWISVGLTLASILYRVTRDFGAPKTIREFRWRLRNLDMTFDQLVKEMMKVSDVEPSTYDEFRAAIIQDLESRSLSHG